MKTLKTLQNHQQIDISNSQPIDYEELMCPRSQFATLNAQDADNEGVTEHQQIQDDASEKRGRNIKHRRNLTPDLAPEVRNVNNRRWSAYPRGTGGERPPQPSAPAGAEHDRGTDFQSVRMPTPTHGLQIRAPFLLFNPWERRRLGGDSSPAGHRRSQAVDYKSVPLLFNPCRGWMRGGRLPPVPRGYALHRRLFTFNASGVDGRMQYAPTKRLFTFNASGVDGRMQYASTKRLFTFNASGVPLSQSPNMRKGFALIGRAA